MENKISRSLPEESQSEHQFLKLAHLYNMFKGKQRHMAEMLDIFMEQLPEALSKIEQYIEQKDKKSIKHEAHTIKSTIKNVGLKELAKTVLTLEYCEADSWERINVNYKAFKSEALCEAEALNEERDLLLKTSKYQ